MPATVDDFRGYHQSAGALPVERNVYLATILDTARYEIQEFAPVPDTDDAAELLDYDDRLVNAQLRIAAYLFDTKGGHHSNRPGFEEFGAQSYDVKGTAVYQGAMRTMGPFVAGAIAYLSRDPL